jgi:hypothetical protein
MSSVMIVLIVREVSQVVKAFYISIENLLS